MFEELGFGFMYYVLCHAEPHYENTRIVLIDLRIMSHHDHGYGVLYKLRYGGFV